MEESKSLIKCSYAELLEIDSPKLINNPKNMNQHPKDQISRLSKLIQYQGQRHPVLISNRSGFIVAGHGRYEAIKRLKSIGWDKVAVDYQDFEDEAQEYAFMVSDNAIQEWADLDLSMVNTEMLDLGPDFNIDLLGLKDFVIEPIEKFEAQCDEDEVPEVKESKVKRGDIWRLGNHRMMCGDSTMIDDVEKLMGGEKADMVYTDPPYGINEETDRAFASRTRKAKGNTFRKIIGDDSIQTALDILPLIESIPVHVLWGASYYCHSLPQVSNWLVWDKREEEKERDRNSDCELAYIKHSKSSVRIFRHKWKGMIKASEHGQARVHPTQKPIALAEWCFNELQPDGKSVLDLFLGSGSTLIACEKTNRKCYGMELDEHYCQVIIDRWEKFTGKVAELIGDQDVTT